MRDDVKLTVDTLRYCEESGACCGECPSGVGKNGVPNCHSQACIADLIESLAAELEQVKQERDGLNALLEQAQAMLETRTRERDAVVESVHGICFHCAHDEPGKLWHEKQICHECRYHINEEAKQDNWQWRGVKEKTA